MSCSAILGNGRFQAKYVSSVSVDLKTLHLFQSYLLFEQCFDYFRHFQKSRFLSLIFNSRTWVYL